VRTGLEDDSVKRFDPLEHPLVRRLLPEYLAEIEEAEARVAELDGQIAAAAESGGDDEDEACDSDDRPSEEEVRAMKRDVVAAKKQLKALQGQLVRRLVTARGTLDSDGARKMALDAMRGELVEQLDRYVRLRRSQAVVVAEGWWEKYSTPLAYITQIRDRAGDRLGQLMEELAYAR